MKHCKTDYVEGAKHFGSCAEYRRGDYCVMFVSKEAGRTKSEEQLAIAHEVSNIVAVVCATLLILGVFGTLVALAIFGR